MKKIDAAVREVLLVWLLGVYQPKIKGQNLDDEINADCYVNVIIIRQMHTSVYRYFPFD